MMAHHKFVQIAVAPPGPHDDPSEANSLYALDDAGNVWVYWPSDSVWHVLSMQREAPTPPRARRPKIVLEEGR
jgi:hypothetical protein